MKKLIQLSGILIFLSVILTLYSYFIELKYLVYAGMLLWFSFFILFFTLNKKKMIIILFILSIILFGVSYVNSYAIDIKKILTINQYLITLLISISFLRLIPVTKSDNYTIQAKGKKSFVLTYFSVFIFSSVINISALILIADKLFEKRSFFDSKIKLLTRSFASNAYWSPFFVSFAAASIYAPSLNIYLVLLSGLTLAMVAFFLTYYEVIKNEHVNIDNFIGYPLTFSNFILPCLLAFLVLLTHFLYFDAKVIVLISLFSLIISFGYLIIKEGIFQTKNRHISHIAKELPKMKGEISLFLVAGMFGVSVSSILMGLNLPLPFDTFDWMGASVLLLVFIVLGFIGIHPIITIAIISQYLTQVNNTLLAVTFLMGWATTVSTSPFSGLNLTMASKYNIDSKKIFHLNIWYSLKIYFVSVFLLYVLSKYLN